MVSAKLYYKWMRLGYGEYRFGLADENAPELSPRDMPVQLYRFAFDSHMRFILFSDTRSIYSDFAFVFKQLDFSTTDQSFIISKTIHSICTIVYNGLRCWGV